MGSRDASLGGFPRAPGAVPGVGSQVGSWEVSKGGILNGLPGSAWVVPGQS